MTRLPIMLWIAAAIGLCGGVSPARADESAVADLVVTGADAPFRIRLDARHAGVLWREHHNQTRGQYFAALLKQLDGDGDGRLNAAEAARLPSPEVVIDHRVAGDVHVAFNFRVVDRDGNSGVDLEELRTYFDGIFHNASGNTAIRLAAAPTPPRGDSLFDALDADRDGRITLNELPTAAQLLALDRNEDRVLVDGELRPNTVSFGPEFVARPQRRSRGGPLTTRLEFVGDASPDAVIRFDLAADRDAYPVPLERVALSDNKVGILQPPAEVVGNASATWIVAGRWLSIEVAPPALRTDQLRIETWRREFEAADADGDGRIALADSLPERLRKSASVMDHNGDSSLERVELEGYLEAVAPLQAAADQARLIVTLHEEARGMFALVDHDRDGRLGVRELNSLPALVRWLADDDGALAADEIPACLRVVLRTSDAFDSEESQLANGSGPPWHFRMDRNRDGDIDTFEFLGSGPAFQQLDLDRDGLIDVSEALRAEKELSQ